METVLYFDCNCYYVEKAGKDINGNSKFKVYAYNENAHTIITGIVKAYLHRRLGSNNDNIRIGYKWTKDGNYKIVSAE